MELISTHLGQILLGIFLAINIFAFIVMAHDKRKAIRGHNVDRASEGYIFFLATSFGGIGIYISMLVFRHKTRKWYFQLGIPLLILQNLASMYVILNANI